MSQIRNALKEFFDKKQNRQVLVRGLLGDGTDQVEVPDTPNWVFVRIGGDVAQVYNNRVAALPDLEVWVGIDPAMPGVPQILGAGASGVYDGEAGPASLLMKHGETHAWDGGDPVAVWPQQVLAGKVAAYVGLTVVVYPMLVWAAEPGAFMLVQSEAPIDMTFYQPVTADKAVFVLVTIDTAGALVWTAGDEVDLAALTLEDIPAPPVGCQHVLAAVRLYFGQEAIYEAVEGSDIIDLRGTSLDKVLTGDDLFLRLDASNGPITGQLASSVSTGTAPLAVDSVTLNVNLNADLLDGRQGADYLLDPMTDAGDLITATHAYRVTVDQVDTTPTYVMQRQTGETILPQMTGTIDAIDTGHPVTIHADVWVSRTYTPWDGKLWLRLHRDSVGGDVLTYVEWWPAAGSDDSGHQHMMTIDYTDNTPTTGTYILSLYWPNYGFDDVCWFLSDERHLLIEGTTLGLVPEALPIGSTGQVLTVAGGTPAWASVGYSGTNTGDVTLAADHGLSLSGQVLALGTPSTVTGSSTNAVATTTHSHALDNDLTSLTKYLKLTGGTLTGAVEAPYLTINTNGSGALFSTYKHEFADGYNLWIGGGGTSSTAVSGSGAQGSRNLAIGESAMLSSTTGYNNLAAGYSSLTSNTTGYNNAAIGYNSLHSNTTGRTNVGIGFEAMYSNKVGYENVAIGNTALRNNVAGIWNTAIGHEAGLSLGTLVNNTNPTAAANPLANVCIGTSALRNSLIGNSNVAIGTNALYLSQADLNVGIGSTALAATTSAKDAGTAVATSYAGGSAINIYSPAHGLPAGTTTVTLFDSLNYNQTGRTATYIDANNFWVNRVYVSDQPVKWLATAQGTLNTAVGTSAGNRNTTGSTNTFIGANTGQSASQLATGSNITVLGYNAYSTLSNAVILGNTGVTTLGIGTYTPTAHVHIVGNSDIIGLHVVSNSTQTTDLARFGSASNYLAIEADGTIRLVGTATYWRDIDFPLVAKTTGVGLPAYATLQGNLTMLQWAVNDALPCDSQEVVHEVMEGSTGSVHFHLITSGTDASNRYVKVEFEYTWADFGETLPANATLTSAELLIPANTPALTHFIFTIGSITFTGGKIGAHAKGRFKRLAATGTAPTGNPFIELVQMHVECDTLGSRTTSAK